MGLVGKVGAVTPTEEKVKAVKIVNEMIKGFKIFVFINTPFPIFG